MSWVWGNKDKEQKTQMDFVAKNRRRDLIKRTLVVHLELEMEYPSAEDIIQAIRDTRTTFDLPMGVELKDAHIAHIEVLGEPSE